VPGKLREVGENLRERMPVEPLLKRLANLFKRVPAGPLHKWKTAESAHARTHIKRKGSEIERNLVYKNL